MISQSDLVESYFGYWPEFADAKVVEFTWSIAGSLRLVLCYVDAQQSKAATVGLLFSGVSNLELAELLTENVLDMLSIKAGKPMVVELIACIGLGGTFSCTEVTVTEVAPNNSFQRTRCARR